MNRIFVSFLFILIYHITGTLTSCSEQSCAGGEPWIMSATEMNIAPYYLRGNDTLQVLSFRNDTIDFDNAFIKLDWIYSSAFNNQWNSLFSSAYAEAGPSYMSIETIEITSNQDYNQDYPAGTSLNDILLFKASGTDLNLEKFTGKVNSSRIMGNKIFARFAEAPSEIRRHQFTVSIINGDGRQVTNKSEEVIIK